MTRAPTLLLFLLSCAASHGQTAAAPDRSQTLEALRKAAAFYRNQVSTEGGYHFSYAADLSYGEIERHSVAMGRLVLESAIAIGICGR